MTNDKHEENVGVEGNTSTNAARNIIDELVHTSRKKRGMYDYRTRVNGE